MLKPYIYKNLKEHGNTVISKKTLEKLGKDNIITRLKEQGFDVDITIFVHSETDSDFGKRKFEHAVIQVKEA